MSRIKEAFGRGKAFIPFLTCGDPDLETTLELCKAIEDAGADLIELGIPFSDPIAEGPVIQKASLRALSGGVTTDKIFDLVNKVRKTVRLPLLFMTYANVVFSYGTERFVKTATEIGIDGLILPDVPFEEKGDFGHICKMCGLDLISFIAPTSHERISIIAQEAAGFIYCISSLGVTGVRDKINPDIDKMIGLVRKSTTVPTAIGFGVSTQEQAAKLAEKSDGVIVGSAIVKLIERYGRDAVPYVFNYAKKMKLAITKQISI
ncbi:MAG: tryptophan synthase subunit alpha [Peptococcaceae bacterium]|nr:tryptophan synthase subunit alpha [Peptococcaceae bacterium]